MVLEVFSLCKRVKDPLNLPATFVVVALAIYYSAVKVNLSSMSQLLPNHGVDIAFFHNHAKIRTSGRTFTEAQRNGFYPLDIYYPDRQATSFSYTSYGLLDPNLQIWHDCIGLLGEQNLVRLRAMSTGRNTVSEVCICESCFGRRMSEVPHNTVSQKRKYPLEFIRTDIAGPFSVTGYDWSRYWVAFLDDYSQFSQVVPIAKKSEMFSHLK